MKEIYKKIITIWTWLVIHIFDCWLMLPLMDDVLGIRNHDLALLPSAVYLFLSMISTLFLLWYSRIHQKSYFISIYSSIVIISLTVRNTFLSSMNGSIAYYMIIAPFAGLTTMAKIQKRFLTVVYIICIFLLLLNHTQMARKICRLCMRQTEYKNDH